LKNIRFILILILSYSELFSQNSNDTILRISEVKITETKISDSDRRLIICYKQQKIDADIIKQNITKSLSELLSENSSIFIKSYGQGSLATASIRGTGASHTQVLWNGIPVNNPMLGQTDFSTIPVFFIDNAEILKGGSSLISTNGALGGSILLNSDSETRKGISSEIIQTFGSNSSYQTFLKISAGNLKTGTTLKLFHEQSENDFKFYNNAVGNPGYVRQKNADYEKNALLNTAYFNFSKNKTLSVNTWLQYGNRNIPSVMSFQGNDKIENQQDADIKSVAEYFYQKNKIETKVSTGFVSENLHYFSGNETETELFIRTNSESKTKRFFVKLNSDYTAENRFFLRTELTSEYQKAEYKDEKTETKYIADRKITDFLLYSDYKINKNINAFLLLRTNFTDKYFLPPMPSAGFKLNFNKIPVTIHSNISRNYKNPTLNDLYWIPGGNINLKPEQGYTGDLSLNFIPIKKTKFTTNINISGYISKINNWIIWKPSDFLYWKAENIKKVFSRGLEISLSEKYETKKIKIQFKSNYSYTKTTDETDADKNSFKKQLIYIPVHKANMFIKVKYFNWFINFSQIYTGQRFTSSSNEETRHTLPAFHIENLTAGKMFHFKKIKAETQFKVMNIVNTNYQEILWRAMPGRQFMLIIKIEY